MASESVDRKWLMVMSNQLWFASNLLVSKPLCIKMTCLYLDSHTTQPRVQTWCILSIRCKTNHQWEKYTGASFFWREMFFICEGQRKTSESYKESNLRSLDSQLQCSTTEPQRLYGKQGPLQRFSIMNFRWISHSDVLFEWGITKVFIQY